MAEVLGVVYLNAVPGGNDGDVLIGYLRELINSLLSLVERVSGSALGVGCPVVGSVGTSLRLVSVSLSVSGVVERLSCGALGCGGVLGCLVSGGLSLVSGGLSLISGNLRGSGLAINGIKEGLDSLGNKTYSIGAG